MLSKKEGYQFAESCASDD